jgi:UDP-glucose 4-epimerase|nr:MAG TPA: UDP-N-acetylglucosamine 4,6-dehydratase/5-epimerase [Caudoviricetes sp.]
MFEGKKILVTGGTGTFGNAFVTRALKTDAEEIRVFSRDELKQDNMRRKYQTDRIRYIIGDVRDPGTLEQAVSGVDYVFHAAALKQVPSCEFYPLEAAKTNVIGTGNVLDAAIRAKVRKVVVLSTDKAAYPINAMGISKALMEKVAVSKGMYQDETIICRTRYGNVMRSRGSVIPLFSKQIQDGKNLTVTDPLMTRFMMTIEDAVELVLKAFADGRQGELWIKKAPAATIGTLARAMIELHNADADIDIIGNRHGEKMHETLATAEEMAVAVDNGEYFIIPPDKRGLNYDAYTHLPDLKVKSVNPYSSDIARRLDIKEMKELLMKAGEIPA